MDQSQGVSHSGRGQAWSRRDLKGRESIAVERPLLWDVVNTASLSSWNAHPFFVIILQ